MADNEDAAKKAAAEAKKKDEELRKAQAEQRAGLEESKPTPTQDENDRTANGEHILEHEPDGSPEEGNVVTPASHGKQSTAKPSGGSYSTRQATPAPAAPTHHRPIEK